MNKELLHKLFEYRDGLLIWKVDPKTGNKRIGTISGTVNGNGYRQVIVEGKIRLYHRVIFMYHHGYLPKYVDHRDRNRLNNKIENLREATAEQNQRNRGLGRNNTTGYLGVSFCNQTKKYVAGTKYKGKHLNMGRFETPELASEAYNNWASKTYKEYAHV